MQGKPTAFQGVQPDQLACTLWLPWSGSQLHRTRHINRQKKCNILAMAMPLQKMNRPAKVTCITWPHLILFEPHVVLAASRRLQVRLRKTVLFALASNATWTPDLLCIDPARLYSRRAFVLRSKRPLGKRAHLSPQRRQKMLLLPRYMHDLSKKEAHMDLQRILLVAGGGEPKSCCACSHSS